MNHIFMLGFGDLGHAFTMDQRRIVSGISVVRALLQGCSEAIQLSISATNDWILIQTSSGLDDLEFELNPSRQCRDE